MTEATVADTLREYQSLLELLDDAYWEASTIQHKDMLYDIISILSQEVAEINKLSIQHGNIIIKTHFGKWMTA